MSWTSAALVLVLPFAAGCGAGKGNETDSERATPYTASANLGQLDVRAGRLVATAAAPAAATTPSASPSGAAASPAASGYLTLVIVNRGSQPDTLTNATIAGGTISPGGLGAAGLTVGPQSTEQFVDPESGATGPALTVSGGTLTAGTTAAVTLTFQRGGTVRLQVPVVSPSSYGSTAATAPIVTTGSYPTGSPTTSPGPVQP